MKDRYYLFLLIILLGFGILQLIFIPMLPLTYEEGINLQVSSLIKRGYEPYAQIFTLSHPLFVWLIGWLGTLGLGPAGLKLTFSLFGLLLLINTALIARAIFSSLVSLAAVFLLVASTSFLFEAADVLAIIPSLSLATLAMVIALRFVDSKQHAWLILSGLVWGAAIFLSFAAIPTALALLLGVIAFDTHRDGKISVVLNWRNAYSPMVGMWLFGAAVSLGLGVLIAQTDLVFGHLLTDYVTVRENLPVVLEENLRQLGRFMAFNLWLFLFAGYGLVRSYDQPNHPLWLIFGWVMLSVGWLMLQTTLRLVDMATSLPPLAIMAGWGLVEVGRQFHNWVRYRPVRRRNRWIRWGAVGLLTLLLFTWVSWQQAILFRHRDVDTPGYLTQLAQKQEIVDFIQAHTSLDDCVIIDDAALAVAANRLPAPELTSLTRERIEGGLITEAALEALVRERNCTAVVFSKREYSRPLAGFRAWVETYYPNEQGFTRTKIFYQ